MSRCSCCSNASGHIATRTGAGPSVGTTTSGFPNASAAGSSPCGCTATTRTSSASATGPRMCVRCHRGPGLRDPLQAARRCRGHQPASRRRAVAASSAFGRRTSAAAQPHHVCGGCERDVDARAPAGPRATLAARARKFRPRRSWPQRAPNPVEPDTSRDRVSPQAAEPLGSRPARPASYEDVGFSQVFCRSRASRLGDWRETRSDLLVATAKRTLGTDAADSGT